MTRRFAVAIVLLSIPLFALAGTQRAVGLPVSGGFTADVLGIGSMSGAAVSGSVAAVQGSVITLNSGSAPAIRIDASAAKFVSDHGGPASVNDIKAGVRITAFINTSATLTPAAALPAQLIAIESLPDLMVTGAVQSVDIANSKLTILGITISADANTSYGSAFPTFAPITLSSIAVGQVVNVTAALTNGAILARRVQVIAPAVPPSVVIGGTVKSISSTAWIITGKDNKDTTVTIDAQTKIAGDPKVGDSVQVMATIDSAHNYVAVAIVKINQTIKTEMHGWVVSIAPEEWTVGGPPGSMAPLFLVKITPATVIYPDPHVGDRVTVTGVRDSKSLFTATKISKD